MSAIAETPTDGNYEVIQVLMLLTPSFNALHFTGPLEVLTSALHNINDPKTKAFEITVAASTPAVKSHSGLTIKADIDFDSAHEDLKDYDIIIVPGAPIEAIEKVLNPLDAPQSPSPENMPEPMKLIKAFCDLQQTDPSKERTMMGIDTGSMLLGRAGVLQGLSATTHPDHYTKFEILCRDAARRGDLEQTDVMEERYVVNNARFDLGDKLEENPFILSHRPRLDGRRKSTARKGSEAYKESKRRESIVKRSQLRLGGLRVITSGGVTSGIDSALYLVAALVSIESAQEVARVLQYTWIKGVTVEAIDV